MTDVRDTLLAVTDTWAGKLVPCDKVLINCDGSINTNGGKNPEGIEASWGFAAHTDTGVPIAWKSDRVPKESGTTVNVGEYFAVIKALEALDSVGPQAYHEIPTEVRSDSQLIIRQINGEYSVRKPHLRPLHARVKELSAKWRQICFIWVPREENQLADKLAGLVWERS